MLNVVLIQPEIPNNTGCIGRTCVGANCHLHLVGPLGFEVSDTRLKRAGLDYWTHLTYTMYPEVDDFLQTHPNVRSFVFSAKAEQTLYDVSFQQDDFLIFGGESQGLSSEILNDSRHRPLRIPVNNNVRSLNLATAVGIAVFEGIRQLSR